MVPYREAYRPTVFDYNHTKEENGKNAQFTKLFLLIAEIVCGCLNDVAFAIAGKYMR